MRDLYLVINFLPQMLLKIHAFFAVIQINLERKSSDYYALYIFLR
jgi:hypothetical protein